MKTLRTALFWLHLSAGVGAGLVIALMCVSGAGLAFEEQIVSWAERDARRVTVGTAPLRLSELQRQFADAHPEVQNVSITLWNDPAATIAFSTGRESVWYVDPYRGDIRHPASIGMRRFMRSLHEWHRFLARDGEQRPVGRAINAACNLAFLFLALSGLYLWLPRTWSWQGFKAVALLNTGLRGKPREFNWHNSIGLWCAPILIVLTATAVPISYRWGANLVYRLAGENPPAQASPRGAPPPAADLGRPPADQPAVSHDTVVARAQHDYPRWESITLRPGASPRAPDANASGPIPPPTASRAATTIQVTVRAAGSWPRTATTTLTVNSSTGEILKREEFDDLSAGRRLRAWTRFLHTGQALGWGGQLLAGLASAGGCLLVYTGFALAWRRFLARRKVGA